MVSIEPSVSCGKFSIDNAHYHITQRSREHKLSIDQPSKSNNKNDTSDSQGALHTFENIDYSFFFDEVKLSAHNK